MAPDTNDYTPVAPWYDLTRDMPVTLLGACFDRVRALTGLHPPARILDAGCGTAQLSLPLMADGFGVVGIDISTAMLEVARRKVQADWDATFIAGDVRRMDFPDGHFDATVVSKVFQHVGEWTRAVEEICRVTATGGYLIHVAEKGAFKNAVRARFAFECDQRGFVERYPGFGDRTQLATYLTETHADQVPIDATDLTWTKHISFEEALQHLALRLHSEFWAIPDHQYDLMLRAVEAWAHSQPDGLATIETMHPYLTAEVFTIR